MYSIGLMSGTSMDGIDAALLETDGETAIKELGHISIPYDTHFKILLKAAEFAVNKYQGDLQHSKNFFPNDIKHYLIDKLKISELNLDNEIKKLSAYIHGKKHDVQTISFDKIVQHSTQLHEQAIKKLLKETNYKPEMIDVVGYHGQTLYHYPSARMTIQIGDGQALADQIGNIVVDDFRSHDVANGGQGAPFAPLYHQALANRDNRIPLVLINCGGIANITLITGVTENDVVGFDTGPGNGLVDGFIRERTQAKEVMDENGQYGSVGKVNDSVFKLLYDKAVIKDGINYLTRKPPKSLDINDLQLIPELRLLSVYDACATLEAFTADTIINSLKFIDIKPKYFVLAGGGWENPVILREFKNRLTKKAGNNVLIKTANELGWSSKAMEAQIFAWLAVRSLKNLPLSVPETTGVPKPLSGGHAHIPSGKQLTSTMVKLLEKNPSVLTGYKPV